MAFARGSTDARIFLMESLQRPTKREWPSANVAFIIEGAMPILITFLCGIANFALHKAVIESRHPLVDALPEALRAHGGRLSLGLEFLVLLVALVFASRGWPGAAWIYGVYSAFNAFAAWLMLGRRI